MSDRIESKPKEGAEFFPHLRSLGISNIRDSGFFHCDSLGCILRKVVCVVRRTRLKCVGLDSVGPAYPQCFTCLQGAGIESEVILSSKFIVSESIKKEVIESQRKKRPYRRRNLS